MTSWPIVTLGEIFDIARGGSPRPIDKFITEDSDGINWIMIGDTSDNSRYIAGTKKKIKPSGVSRSRLVRPGDFLLTNSMSFGRPYIMKTSGCIHDGWLVLHPKSHQVDPDYFYHLLSSPAIYSEFARRAAGAVVKNLSIALVKDIQITLPPLEEQKRITAILDKADTILKKRQHTLDLADQFLRSIFLDMFGDPITNPRGWKGELLGNVIVGKPDNGIFKKNSEYGEGIPVVWVEQLFKGREINLTNSEKLLVTESERKKFGLKNGDILFCRSSLKKEGIGFNNIYVGDDYNSLFECHLIRIKPNHKLINPIFLNYLLKTKNMRKRVIQNSNTVTMTTITQGGIKDIEIINPPLSAQDQFEIIFNKIKVLESKLNNYENFSSNCLKSLTQRAFQGEL